MPRFENDLINSCVLRFSTISNATTKMIDMPEHLISACAVWDNANSVAYIFGGSYGHNSNKQIFKFSPVTKMFELTGIELHTPPKFCTAVWAGDARKIYILLSEQYLWSESKLFRFDPDCATQPITEVAVTGLPDRWGYRI